MHEGGDAPAAQWHPLRGQSRRCSAVCAALPHCLPRPLPSTLPRRAARPTLLPSCSKAFLNTGLDTRLQDVWQHVSAAAWREGGRHQAREALHRRRA